MTLIATPGASDANSYCTVAQAKVFLSERLAATDWILAPDVEEQQSLIWATQLIDQQAQWKVTSATTTQALWWPVSDAVDARGVVLAANVIPAFLARATAVYGLALWIAWKNPHDSRVKRVDLGAVQIEWQPGQALPHEQMPAEVRQAIGLYGAVVGSGRIPVLRV